jgi:hypothetical protein
MPKKKEKVVMLPRPPSPGDPDNPILGTTIRISENTRSRLIDRSTKMDQTYDYLINGLLDEANKWIAIYDLMDAVEKDLKTQGPEVIRLAKEVTAFAKKSRERQK